jgi:hypothetical protein
MASLDAIMTVTVLPPEKNPLMGAPNAISGSTPDGANFKRVFLIGNFQIVETILDLRRSILVSGTIRGHEYHLVARPPRLIQIVIGESVCQEIPSRRCICYKQGHE